MKAIAEAVLRAINDEGLVPVEVSARHVHLDTQALRILFGPEGTLTPKKELSQPGQFLSEERVSVIGPKGRKDHVAVLGPERKDTQVELSESDCQLLGIKSPVRESGDVAASGKITIEGPCGVVHLATGAIVAHRHLHMTPKMAEIFGVADRDHVSVRIYSERPVIFLDVIVRVNPNFKTRMHIDFDEANAAGVKGFTLGKIMK